METWQDGWQIIVTYEREDESLMIPGYSGRVTRRVDINSSRNDGQVRRNIPGAQVHKLFEF
jgi:hypothetical protein